MTNPRTNKSSSSWRKRFQQFISPQSEATSENTTAEILFPEDESHAVEQQIQATVNQVQRQLSDQTQATFQKILAQIPAAERDDPEINTAVLSALAHLRRNDQELSAETETWLRHKLGHPRPELDETQIIDENAQNQREEDDHE